MNDLKNSAAEFAAWRNSPEGKAAAAKADRMTKAEMIAEIVCTMMRIAHEPEEEIERMRQKCLHGGTEATT